MSIVIIGKGLAVGVVAVTALLAGGTTQHATPDAAASTSSAKAACHGLFRHAPAALKKDLRAARQLPKGVERRAALKKIRKGALAGQYGAKVQQIAEHRKQRRAHWLKQAPAQLRQDLKAAVQLPAGAQRKAAVQAVWQSALDGTYGQKMQQRAQHRKAHHDACQAQRQQRRSDKQKQGQS
ncbi:MAG: hypothetical protein M3Y66_00795 [Actinomycetota bacterium]|nr:hypothetical protein [Actinomycetota bacterium]